MNTASSSGSGTLPSNTITNPKEDLKGITTRSGISYKGPTIPSTSSPPKVVEYETKVTKDTVPPTNNGITKDVQPPVVQVETQVLNSEPVVAPVVEPVKAPVSASKPNSKPSIPYPSRLNDQKLREKANNQMEKFFQIFQDLNFNISFADALIFMPKFALTIKSLLTNKEKLFELARTPLNEHCQFMKMNTASSSGSRTTNPKEDLKGITTRSGIEYKGPMIPTTFSPPKVVERETEVTKDTVPPTNNESTKDVQPPVIQVETQIPNSELVVAPLLSQLKLPDSDFLLEETDAFLVIKDEPISPEIDDSFYDSEGDMLLL
nr:reverse transcriptase domain-containing protein [Tanacetum cinerariifolium]